MMYDPLAIDRQRQDQAYLRRRADRMGQTPASERRPRPHFRPARSRG